MKFEKNIKKLETFRLKVENLKSKEDTKIENLLKWRENLTKKSIVSSKLINFNEVKGWHSDSNGNIHHKSGQFFSLQGVRTEGAAGREVQTWDQPILSQKHGGVLAFLARETKDHGIQFLLEGKTEPGDDGDVKFCPSYQATQSNINRAHGGKLPDLTNMILDHKGAQLIYETSHNEEGARFWKKTNYNLILMLDDPENNETKKENYIWASLTQIKKLSLIDNIINPFVKTILFMI